MALERTDGLVDQRHPVGQEQHALDPVAPHQQVTQGDDRPGLPRTGRHDHERLALVVFLKRLGDAANRAGLVETLDDVLVDGSVRQRLARLRAAG